MKGNRPLSKTPRSAASVSLLLAALALPSTVPALAAEAATDAKKKAAALLSAPMSAKVDDGSSLKKHEQAPPVAPPIENGKARARTYLKEGARLHRIGEYAEAERLFREAIALDPRNADGFFNLGALAEGRGDLIAALSQYRAGLTIQPNDGALKEAVQAIETRLAAGESAASPHVAGSAREGGAFRLPERNFYGGDAKTDNPYTPALLSVTTPNLPAVPQYSDPVPVIPVDTVGPFQLHSSQNAITAGANNFGVLNASAGSINANMGVGSMPAPILTVRQGGNSRRAAGAAFGAALNIGMRAALSGSGMRCPACRWLRF